MSPGGSITFAASSAVLKFKARVVSIWSWNECSADNVWQDKKNINEKASCSVSDADTHLSWVLEVLRELNLPVATERQETQCPAEIRTSGCVFMTTAQLFISGRLSEAVILLEALFTATPATCVWRSAQVCALGLCTWWLLSVHTVSTLKHYHMWVIFKKKQKKNS